MTCWHLFVVRCVRRDELHTALLEAGVQTAIHYPIPPHLQPAYADLGHTEGSFPLSECLHREVLSLPMGPTLSDDEVAEVIAAITRVATLLDLPATTASSAV